MWTEPAIGDPTERLLEARGQAEEDLLSDVAFTRSLTAGSGTEGFGYENVVGVGIGERLSKGRPTGVLAVTVYVVRKAPLDDIEDSARVPAGYEGVPTDVVESGEFLAYTERGRFRPAPRGVSLAHHQDTAGTLGFVGSRQGELVVVSNNHVLARENEARRGDAILQPGPSDGGTATDASTTATYALRTSRSAAITVSALTSERPRADTRASSSSSVGREAASSRSRLT